MAPNVEHRQAQEVAVEGPSSGPTSERGSMRRALGLSLLHAVRSLGELMTRTKRTSGYDVAALTDAIDCVETLLTTLRTVHAAESRAAHS
jgi:hypothetical protein